jgi:predicted 3-demethylubiquinone-9 3-methyltransferase (glyoxalase superfamily)
MQKIVTYLWFNNDAKEAIQFYASIFKDSKVLRTSRYGDAGPGPTGSLMMATFQLEGQEFMALNGGPQYTFNEAISLLVNCTSQDEIDELWIKLSEGGEPEPCGWLKDKFGVSWQIIPTALGELLSSPDAASAERVMRAMLQMQKIDIAALRQAAEQQPV